MNNASKICSALLALTLTSATGFASDVAVDGSWRRIFNLDFGGNAESDPQFGTELKSFQGETSIQFRGGVSAGTTYTLGKFAQSGNSAKFATFPDHTYNDDRNRGYYLMLNSPQSCGGLSSKPCNATSLDYTDGKSFIYKKSLVKNICQNVTFKFECYVANMNLEDPSSAGSSAIALAVFDGQNKEISKKHVSLSGCGDSPNGNWTKIELEFSVPSTSDVSNLDFKIIPMIDGDYGAENAGYDFGLDDISIYIQQPKLTFDHDEFLYNMPVSLTAKMDDTPFFADMNDVAYVWEFSPTGDDGTWTQVGKGDYKSNKNFAYEIDKFDKGNNAGKGNGYYRLTLATKDMINSIDDESVCCVRDVYFINETKNKVLLYLCEGGEQDIDGRNFTGADDGKEITTTNNFVVTTHVMKNTIRDTTYKICIGTEFPLGSGKVYTEIATVDLGKEVTKKWTRLNYSGQVCDSITLVKTLKVTDGDTTKNKVEHICQGSASSFNKKVYDYVGEYSDTKKEGCLIYLQPISVDSIYVIEKEETICENSVYEGKTYTTSGDYDLPAKKFKTIWGCDSTRKIKLHVTKHTEATLDDIELCQSDFGEGETAFTYDGKKYLNEGKNDLVLDLEKTDISNVNGCDSITKVHVTIHPMIHVFRDTLGCLNQKLWGLEYNVAGNYTRDEHYTSVNGCDSLVTWRIKIINVQLKLRAEFGLNSVCEGQSSTLIVDLIPSDVPLTWEPELASRNPLRPVVAPEVTTLYVAHARNSVGCHATDSITIGVYPNPELTIDTILQQERKLLFNVVGGTPEYTFMMGTKEVTPGPDNSLEHLTYGTHEFRVTDSIGCAAVDTFLLEPLPIDAPAFLSPNGDGVNDTWEVANIDAYPDARIRIFDRFGKLLWEQTGLQVGGGWNGTCNGKKCPSTDYWYIIDVDSIDKQYIGHFTLLR